MECSKIEKLMDRFIRKELDAHFQSKVETHIENCPYCKDQLEFYRSFDSLSIFYDEIKPPKDFTDNIMDQIRSINKKRSNKHLIYKLWGNSMVAAAIIMMLINIVGMKNGVNCEKVFEKALNVHQNAVVAVNDINKLIFKEMDNLMINSRRD